MGLEKEGMTWGQNGGAGKGECVRLSLDFLVSARLTVKEDAMNLTIQKPSKNRNKKILSIYC